MEKIVEGGTVFDMLPNHIKKLVRIAEEIEREEKQKDNISDNLTSFTKNYI